MRRHLSGAGCGSCARGTQPRTRAARGSARRTLGSACQELAETGGQPPRKARPGTETKPPAERRKARASSPDAQPRRKARIG